MKLIQICVAWHHEHCFPQDLMGILKIKVIKKFMFHPGSKCEAEDGKPCVEVKVQLGKNGENGTDNWLPQSPLLKSFK